MKQGMRDLITERVWQLHTDGDTFAAIATRLTEDCTNTLDGSWPWSKDHVESVVMKRARERATGYPCENCGYIGQKNDDPEVKIGDAFVYRNGCRYMIAKSGESRVQLVNVDTGYRWAKDIRKKTIMRLSHFVGSTNFPDFAPCNITIMHTIK